jgi:hypothetical protein
MADGRGRSVGSLRNLPQFKGMSDEEIMAATQVSTLEEQVAARIEELGEEFDLSDMKYHDLLILQRFFTALIRLEKAEAELAEKYDDLPAGEKSREETALSTLRGDVLRMQNELGISKLRRNAEVEDNPMVMFSDVRARAKKFLEERLCWVICPKCGMQVAKVHFTYTQVTATLKMMCGRCEVEFSVTAEELLQKERENPYR